MMRDLPEWMDEVTGREFVWYVKRLSGNDTLANGSHQAGPYIPKEFLFSIFPSLDRPDIQNPDVRIDLSADSHDKRCNIRVIWYNNRLHGGTRNEARITNLGGISSPLLDPENTGALAIFAFILDRNGEAEACRVWVCRNETEENLIEDRIGPIEPGKWRIWTQDEAGLFAKKEKAKPRASCWLEPDEIPAAWLSEFPTGLDIIRKTIEFRPADGLDPDHRLLKRRDCEYEMFRSIEEAIELPWIKKGFGDIDEFIARAQTILQRRKARSGRSLELHTREILLEEGLKEGEGFDHQPESEPGKRPDFLFPSEVAYKNHGFSADGLRMLAVKTTCKDRWRQILNEADRIGRKHLLTLQEGVSETQFKEMMTAGVQLVVPAPLVASYPKQVQPHLHTLEVFIQGVRLLNA